MRKTIWTIVIILILVIIGMWVFDHRVAKAPEGALPAAQTSTPGY